MEGVAVVVPKQYLAIDNSLPTTSHSAQVHHDSSDGEESNPLSTTTSWEYLSKANSWSDLRYLRSTSMQQQPCLRTSPRHQINRICKTKTPNSNNSSNTSSSNHDPVSFHNEKSSLNHSQITRSASFHIDPPLPQNVNGSVNFNNRNNISDFKSRKFLDKRTNNKNPNNTSKTDDDDDDDPLCYNVPYQCDIYSLPVDSIKSNNDVEKKRPIAAPRRGRVRGGATNSSRVKTYKLTTTEVSSSQPSELGEAGPSSISRCSEETTSTNFHARQKALIQPSISMDTSSQVSRSSTQNKMTNSRNERNNNTDDDINRQLPSAETGENWKKSTRRSRSVEMSISLTCVNTYQNNSSQKSFFSKESALELSVAKPEKRTIGHSILNLFKRNRPRCKTEHLLNSASISDDANSSKEETCTTNVARALPPTPVPPTAEPSVQISTTLPDHLELPWEEEKEPTSNARDFAASIEKVKDCGWYWGPLSSEAAEDLLRGEPDGSFIVRDSSDAHYIFSLTFKLNGLVRHVRIEHDQGNFSFGPLTRFKASTIVDFVEKAVAHSRSGRYLFFLHRRPVLGPMRVQLLHPYSRYRQSRSLQHMCRFVILKYVRRDLIHTLPLPKPLQDYLNTPHYYFEQPDEKKKEK